MMEPHLEDLLAKLDGGKYELITLASRRARDINAYYNQLGAGTRGYIPPQVMSQGKPLSIAFEEIGQDKLVGVRVEPGAEPEEGATDDAASEEVGDADE